MREEKIRLRRSLLKQRLKLSINTWRNQSFSLCQQLQSWHIFQKAETVLGYFSFRQEPDLSPLFEQKTWGFPRCVGQSLHWHFWQPGESLVTGTYGILEPSVSAPIVSPKQVDLILVPAVACDYFGYRLGYGGGFYDRMFYQSQWSSLMAIAIVFDFAYLPRLPVEPWDQKLLGVCTESRVVVTPV